MPFTGSHPALIIPLLKSRYFSASGLIMGSMVPDFEFILLMKAHVIFGHSLLPMLWLNLPLSIVLIFLYHNVIRKALILNLPPYFEKRLRPFLNFDWNDYFKRNVLKVIISIILGNLGHLFWDAFTHKHGIFVEWMPFLEIPFKGMPLYFVLQYGFSLLGALALLLFFHKLPFRKYFPSNRRKEIYWLCIMMVASGIMYLRFNGATRISFDDWIVSSLCAFMGGLLLASIFDWLYYPNEPRLNRMKPINVEVDRSSKQQRKK
ncbi:DUF4184 family protein [Euzebyella marina]|uniref:DUF4184 family protein n=1 Tax=Euzebyella marina TaxID=1761453 RepID=A0A3G2L1Y8_9FLAO|nr:DUF4184 family protein [Euzebyella marina]AYN66269.1 DUF4184 family protein [Euzebyella marina]